jgi:hypothetical protein
MVFITAISQRHQWGCIFLFKPEQDLSIGPSFVLIDITFCVEIS